MMTGAPSGPSTSTFRLLSLICTNIRSPPSCPRPPGTSAGLVTPDPAQHPYGVASHHILDVLVGVVMGGPVPELPTLARRSYEYDHEYGLRLIGKAVPQTRSSDGRSKFLEGFHNLLHLCAVFYEEDDDVITTADGSLILGALRDVHRALAEGAHNQYGDLPWTARQEFLVMEWLLARPEMREFLPGPAREDYPEPWMGRVEAM